MSDEDDRIVIPRPSVSLFDEAAWHLQLGRELSALQVDLSAALATDGLLRPVNYDELKTIIHTYKGAIADSHWHDDVFRFKGGAPGRGAAP